MDVQLADENGKPGYVLQHWELEKLLDHAEKWAEISNDTEKNKKVMEITKIMRKLIKEWRKNEKKGGATRQ